MDIFGAAQRFAGDVYGKVTGGLKAIMPTPPKPVVQPMGPGGSPTGSGLGQARSTGIYPRQAATLDTISWSEGTSNADGSPNYNMRYGDAAGSPGTLDVTKPHPITARPSPWGGSAGSNASGAYQFLDSTWSEMNNNQNPVMSPVNQDRSVIKLIDERTNYDIHSPMAGQVEELSGQWASVPNSAGVSNYNQPAHSAAELEATYAERLAHHEAREQQRLIEMGLR